VDLFRISGGAFPTVLELLKRERATGTCAGQGQPAALNERLRIGQRHPIQRNSAHALAGIAPPCFMHLSPLERAMIGQMTIAATHTGSSRAQKGHAEGACKISLSGYSPTEVVIHITRELFYEEFDRIKAGYESHKAQSLHRQEVNISMFERCRHPFVKLALRTVKTKKKAQTKKGPLK